MFHLSASDAAYIRTDADVEKAIKQVALSSFLSSGQSRNSIKRVFVAKELYDRFRT